MTSCPICNHPMWRIEADPQSMTQFSPFYRCPACGYEDAPDPIVNILDTTPDRTRLALVVLSAALLVVGVAVGVWRMRRTR